MGLLALLPAQSLWYACQRATIWLTAKIRLLLVPMSPALNLTLRLLLLRTLGRGGGGLVVSELASLSDEPNVNFAEAYFGLFCKNIV